MIRNFEKLLIDHSDMCCEVESKDYPPYLDYPKSCKPMTNADRIRTMTDEELAIFLSDVTSNAMIVLEIDSKRKSQSTFDWYTWVKSSVEE